MSAIYSVNDGDDAVADDLNQLVDTLNAVLGITDTAQDALGRLVLPQATSLPGSPSVGELSFQTDEGVQGASGRLYVRHGDDGAGNDIWVPYQPLRQQQLSAAFSSGFSSTSYSDITDATVSITTTGGDILIMVVGGATTGANSQVTISGDATLSYVTVRAVVDSTNLQFSTLGSSATNQGLYATWPMWRYRPVAGSHTVKLQGAVGHSGVTGTGAGQLLVIEYGG